MKNRKLFKNFLIIISSMFFTNIAHANSYIMVSPNDITKIDCANNNVVNMHILTTLTNEKKSVIVTPVADGETSFAIQLKNKKCNYNAKVCGDVLELTGDKTIKILPLDLPPELTKKRGDK